MFGNHFVQFSKWFSFVWNFLISLLKIRSTWNYDISHKINSFATEMVMCSQKFIVIGNWNRLSINCVGICCIVNNEMHVLNKLLCVSVKWWQFIRIYCLTCTINYQARGNFDSVRVHFLSNHSFSVEMSTFARKCTLATISSITQFYWSLKIETILLSKYTIWEQVI